MKEGLIGILEKLDGDKLILIDSHEIIFGDAFLVNITDAVDLTTAGL